VKPIFFVDMDDVLVLDARYTSYQVRECFRLNDMDWQELWDGLVDSVARANLRTLHDEFSPTYVISSSWTKFLTREQLVEVLRRTGLDFVADNLHEEWATPKSPGKYRDDEIWSWLGMVFPGQAPASLPLLALDDNESGWTLAGSPLDRAGQLVLCEVWQGLTPEKLEEAQRLMRAQLRR
jgi:hypothetical protein